MNEKLQQVLDEIEATQQKRRELQAAHNRAKTSIKAQEIALTGELIGGGQATKTLQTVTTERARVDALTQADKDLAAQLETLQAKRAEIEREIAIEEYEQAAASARDHLYQVIGHLYQARAALAQIPSFGPPRGYRSKEATFTRDMIGQMHNFDLHRQLIELERIAPDFMAEARKAGRVTE